MPRHAFSKASSLSALLRCAEPPALFGPLDKVKGAKGTRGCDLNPLKLVRHIDDKAYCADALWLLSRLRVNGTYLSA